MTQEDRTVNSQSSNPKEPTEQHPILPGRSETEITIEDLEQAKSEWREWAPDVYKDLLDAGLLDASDSEDAEPE